MPYDISEDGAGGAIERRHQRFKIGGHPPRARRRTLEARIRGSFSRRYGVRSPRGTTRRAEQPPGREGPLVPSVSFLEAAGCAPVAPRGGVMVPARVSDGPFLVALAPPRDCDADVLWRLRNVLQGSAARRPVARGGATHPAGGGVPGSS